MTITSTAFQNNEMIPKEYTCQGDGVNPPLTFSQIPDGTASLALIVDDPDAPNGLFTHWILYDMSPATLQILQNNLPETGVQGTNDFPSLGYGAPCPPAGPAHHYNFTLYALKAMLKLPQGAARHDVTAAMEGHIIATTRLTGMFAKDSLK